MKAEKNAAETGSTGFSSFGLVGFYFRSTAFNELLLITQNKDSNLSLENTQLSSLCNIDNEQVQSARWLGFIKPPKTDEYIFYTPSNQDIMIQLDQATVELGSSVTLEQDKIYSLRMESRFAENTTTTVACELYWSYSGQNELISESCLLAPDYNNTVFFPQTSLFGDVADETTDSDQDGIPDDWEINGYAFIQPNIVKWDDAYQGTYPKYVSNPYQSHTVGDPYTDFEKASEQIDKAISKEAWNPLVAAYPVIGVGMEKLILSSNENFTTTENHTTGNSKTEANTEGSSFEIGKNKDGFFGGITPNYSHTTSTTNTSEDSSGTTTMINKGDSAYLNANVRYYNTGSAPMYQVTPTTNFVLDTDTIKTITAPPSNIGNSLTPNSTYPASGQNAIALTTVDGSEPITIDYDQLTKLQSGDSLILETTQTTGLFGTYENGTFVTPDTNVWDPYIVQIKASSGSFILDTGSEVFERSVAAKDYSNPNDYTPAITIGEAISIAFGATTQDNLIYYKDVPIYESAVELIYDADTATDIQEQLEASESNNIYDMKLKPGMNILIKCPEIYDNANGSYDNNVFDWSYTYSGQAGIEGKGYSTGGTSYGDWENLVIEQNTRYILSIYVKGFDAFEHQVKLGVGSGDISTFTHIQTYTVNNEWQRLELEFNPAVDNSKFTGVAIQSIDRSTIYFDDIAITKLNPEIIITEDTIKAAHTVKSWNIDESVNYVDGVYLHVEPDYVCEYKLVAADEDRGTHPRYAPDASGTLYVNYTEYNAGHGFSENTHSLVYAVYPGLSPVLVAEWVPS
ncbi:hypothetical protein BBD42_22180 [Paenibacillus sp. BIHB 4019]|uniref:PA14 domain-containing protein n=1 Tax=Paenibacillus sp. BIHB 4019 TaxID=1870819 RepID=A0A1B2DME3_9BACL|nr:binary toxin-like calcium binding domain-containing protein [Paenibacillus sp. BIHB 4019]ANY68883.1 hypothetical protein BBD42_22180 [Paenibacillus sp. BIHB 4019]